MSLYYTRALTSDQFNRTIVKVRKRRPQQDFVTKNNNDTNKNSMSPHSLYLQSLWPWSFTPKISSLI